MSGVPQAPQACGSITLSANGGGGGSLRQMGCGAITLSTGDGGGGEPPEPIRTMSCGQISTSFTGGGGGEPPGGGDLFPPWFPDPFDRDTFWFLGTGGGSVESAAGKTAVAGLAGAAGVYAASRAGLTGDGNN